MRQRNSETYFYSKAGPKLIMFGLLDQCPPVQGGWGPWWWCQTLMNVQCSFMMVLNVNFGGFVYCRTWNGRWHVAILYVVYNIRISHFHMEIRPCSAWLLENVRTELERLQFSEEKIETQIRVARFLESLDLGREEGQNCSVCFQSLPSTMVSWIVFFHPSVTSQVYPVAFQSLSFINNSSPSRPV